MSACKAHQILLIFSLFLVVSCQKNVATDRTKGDDEEFVSQEHKLKLDLMTNYDKDVFPTRHANHTVNVAFGLALTRLAEIDEYKQHVVLHTWVRMEWTDYRLTWNPANYDGVDVLKLPNRLVWQPDISLFNNAGDDHFIPNTQASVIVYSTGSVLFIPAVTFTAHCDFDLTYFPYDSHTCSLKFGSWVHHGFRMNLTYYNDQRGFDLSDFSTSAEWSITDTNSKIFTKYYPCCVEPYPDIRFNFTVVRKSSFFINFYISPGVAMFVLAPFIFFIRPGSTARTILGVGIIIGSVILVSASYLPSFINRTPVVMIYYATIMTESVAFLILSYIIDHTWFCDSKVTPNQYLRKLFLNKVSRVVFVDVADYENPVAQPIEPQDQDTDDKIEEPPLRVAGKIRAEWKALAMVLNRLSFIVCFIVNVIITLAVFH